MKLSIVLLISFMLGLKLAGQDLPATTEQQLENLTDSRQSETVDDSYLQQLEYAKKHRVNVNNASASELKDLFFLNDLQIDNLIRYRELLSQLLSIYELQSVPSWDIPTIKKILPYITIDDASTIGNKLRHRFSKGEQTILFRASEVFEKAKGFDRSLPGTKYAGGRDRLFFRYRYQFKNLLQFGIVGDKDAGEQFFRGAQRLGFDFYSIHLFTRNVGKLQAIAIGDFTVNFGQGLIQWQSLAFSKSADVMNVKRQSPVLRPYTSSGEFYFQRGVGLTAKTGKLETTVFGSLRKLSSNVVADSVNNDDFISSFQNSGYHRTPSEIQDKNNLRQLSAGANMSWHATHWQVGLNAVIYHFSFPVIKRNTLYNLFAIRGSQWSNASIDYSYTRRNMHIFGEMAIDKNIRKACVNGLLISVDPKIDVSILQRAISMKYQAVYGDSFTENNTPTNETGIYAGLTLRPTGNWKLDMYADFFKFPWLKFLVDAPSIGKEFLVQLTFTPSKQLQLYTQLRTGNRQIDLSTDTETLIMPTAVPKQNWRNEFILHINTRFMIRERVEMLWYDRKSGNEENGFLTFFDVLYKPLLKPYSGNVRFSYFETSGYNSRLYAYENDVLYAYSIPPSFNKGCRYYINFRCELRKGLSLWLRWSQNVRLDKNPFGSGLDEIDKAHRSQLEIEGRLIF